MTASGDNHEHQYSCRTGAEIERRRGLPGQACHHFAAGREGITEIRGFMRSIDTSGLSWRMLAAEIRNQGNTMLEPHGIGCVFETVIDDDAAGEPGSLLCLNLFKIHKEALTNTIKHARATTVTVNLSVDNRGLRLMIGDNGIGCSRDDRKGRGLANIRKRAADLGGTVSLSSIQAPGSIWRSPFPCSRGPWDGDRGIYKFKVQSSKLKESTNANAFRFVTELPLTFVLSQRGEGRARGDFLESRSERIPRSLLRG